MNSTWRAGRKAATLLFWMGEVTVASWGCGTTSAHAPIDASQDARPRSVTSEAEKSTAELAKAYRSLCSTGRGSPIQCETGDVACELVAEATSDIRTTACESCGTGASRPLAMLREAPPDALPHMVRALADRDYVVASAVKRVLEERGGRRAIEAFCGQPSTHRAVLCGSGGFPVTTEELVSALRGEDGAASLDAVRLLVELGAGDQVEKACQNPHFPHGDAICALAPLVFVVGSRASRR